MRVSRELFYKFHSVMRDIIVPGLQNSQYAYKEVMKRYVNQESKWLDIGCGHQILPRWMPFSEEEAAIIVKTSKILVGIEYNYQSLQKHKTIKYKTLGDFQKLPFKNCSFDLLTANMVVEHIENPAGVLAEVYRVLEPDGLFIFHTPNLWNYQTIFAYLIPNGLKDKLIEFLEHREGNDVFPTYYRINTPKKIRSLAAASDFKVIELKVVNSSAESIMLGPVVVIELLINRILSLKWFAGLRCNIITVLQKPGY